MKIDLSQWPIDIEDHDHHYFNTNGTYVSLSKEQYELAAQAVWMMAPDEKELPDSEGWWWYMAATTSTWCTVFLGEDLAAGYVGGRWIKIQTPWDV